MDFKIFILALSLFLSSCSDKTNKTLDNYLPSGPYKTAITNFTKVSGESRVCIKFSKNNQKFVSNGKGQVCENSSCYSLYIASNPCSTIYSNFGNGLGSSSSLNNCSFNKLTNILTANIETVLSDNFENTICTGLITFKKID